MNTSNTISPNELIFAVDATHDNNIDTITVLRRRRYSSYATLMLPYFFDIVLFSVDIAATPSAVEYGIPVTYSTELCLCHEYHMNTCHVMPMISYSFLAAAVAITPLLPSFATPPDSVELSRCRQPFRACRLLKCQRYAVKCRFSIDFRRHCRDVANTHHQVTSFGLQPRHAYIPAATPFFRRLIR